MEVDLPSSLLVKLERIAAEQGSDSAKLVQEAVERFVSYEDWFATEVEKGLASADRGELIDHDEVRKLIDSRYPA